MQFFPIIKGNLWRNEKICSFSSSCIIRIQAVKSTFFFFSSYVLYFVSKILVLPLLYQRKMQNFFLHQMIIKDVKMGEFLWKKWENLMKSDYNFHYFFHFFTVVQTYLHEKRERRLHTEFLFFQVFIFYQTKKRFSIISYC